MTVLNKTIYRQADSRWGSLSYPTKAYTFAHNGCGCCAVTHCAIEIEKFKNYTPADVRKYMVQFATKGHGTLWNGIIKGLENYGYNVHWRQADTMADIWKVLSTSLKKGVILFGSSKGGTKKITWTTGGHYVAFVDWKYENGDYWFYMKDSGGRKHDGWYSYRQHMAGDVRNVWICTSLKSGYSLIGSTSTPSNTKTTTTTQYVKYTGAFPTKTIKIGSKGAQVTRWQKFLKWMGYDIKVDGKFGGITKSKTIAAQKKFGFIGKNVDGIVGSKTIAKAKAYKKAIKVTTTSATTQHSTPITSTDDLPKKCIDVSYWQGKISQANWAKIKKSCGYAICRASYTSQSKFSLNTDSTFATNFVNAKAAGLRVGAYHYSQALTVDEAKREAEYLCNILKNYSPTFYVAIDYEYGGRLKASTAGKASEVANAFCDVVKAHGYQPLIYANTLTLNSKLTKPKYPLWVAQYNSTCTYKGSKVMWQYTSSGRVDGISASTTNNKSANVDLSHVYEVYPLQPITQPITQSIVIEQVSESPTTTTLSTLVTKMEKYSGAIPNLITHSGQKIAYTAKALAYPKGTKKSTYTYGKGKATQAFTDAINKVYPNRSKWSKQCQAGASCDVGAGTVIRYSGYDPLIPRGLEEQIPYLQKSKIWEKTNLTKTSQMKAGDVGIYVGKKKGAHIWICVGDALIAEANHTAKYFLHIDTDSYTNSGKKTWGIYRPCSHTSIRKGDKGTEVIKLQSFLNWAGFNCGNVDGDCGDKTFNAIKLFQQNVGLVVDGIVGSQTITKISSYVRVTKEENATPSVPTSSTTSKYTGTLPSIHVTKNASQVIADALKWGAWIVGNNKFHYGEYGKKGYITKGTKYYEGGKYKPIYNVTHSCGCHFCGTEGKKKVNKANKLGYKGENWEYTYVCNTFATAIYAHGGMDDLALSKCRAGKCIGMNEKGRSPALDKDKNWKYMGKLAMKDLKAGDILVTSSHMQTVYAPISSKKVKIIEATSYYGKYKSAASDNSIRIIEKSPSYTSVYRYIGKVDADIAIRYGEYSDRVKLWQQFLKWVGFDCGDVDGKFGDKTLVATKAYQTKYNLTVDGIVGTKSLAQAKVVEK